MAAVRRLNHAVLYVSDADRAAAFYRDNLGFEVVYQFPGAAFLKAANSPNDHDLGLFGLGPNATKPRQTVVGLYHLAWQVDTIEELAALRTQLAKVGSLVGESDHHASKSLYAVDPDGNEFEVMWAVPIAARTGEAGTVRLDLDAELARWAGVSTVAEANILV
jgi:catechol-2,3-dioxygenase